MMAGAPVVLGAAAWFAAAPRLGLPAMDPVALALAVAGSLLPDIDHPKSWVGRRLRPVSTITAAVLGHRGATHSLLAVAGCGWLLFHDGTPRAIVAPLLVGYLSHLAGDLLTPRGLRLAWPLKGTWALPLCRAGSPFEPLLVTALLIAAWCSTAMPATRHALVTASRVCTWAGPDLLPALCPAPRRAQVSPRKRRSVVAANRAGPGA
jgi:inner membrane protein